MSFSTDVTPVPVAILTQIFSLKAEGYFVTPINIMKPLLHFKK